MIQPLDDTAFDTQSALTAVISRDAVWLNELERAQNEVPSTTDARVLGTFGPHAGLLVLEEAGREVYAQSARFVISSDGRLLDGRNRELLGYALDEGKGVAPRPIRVPGAIHGRPLDRYAIDERGLIVGIPPQTDATSSPIPLARIAVALFPSPQRLISAGDVFRADRGAGKPTFSPADAANVGGLVRQPTDARERELQEQAREAYMSSAKAEMQVALAGSRDALIRVALDVVK